MKRVLTAVMAIATVGVLAACGSGKAPGGEASAGGQLTMGFSQVGAESGWRTANTKSIQDAAKAAGVDLKFSDAQQKQENQIKAIRSFIQQRVDVIAFSPGRARPAGTPCSTRPRTPASPSSSPTAPSTRRTTTLYKTFLGSGLHPGGQEGRRVGGRSSSRRAGPVNIVELAGHHRARPRQSTAAGLRRRHQGEPEPQDRSPPRPATSPAPAASRSWRRS